MNLIAHRGAFDNVNIPENSIKAFNEAIKLNLAVEYDVQLTKDNVLVVFHDDNLYRMTGVDKKIEDVTFDEICKLTLLNTKEHIPTLKEVLKLIDNKVFMDIEIKNTKKYKVLCDFLINELKKYNNYSLKSFNPKIVRYLKNNYKDINIGYLIGDYYDKGIFNLILPTKLIIKYSKCNFISISKKLLKKNKFIKLSKKYPTQIWTIKDKQELVNDNYTYICNNIKNM